MNFELQERDVGTTSAEGLLPRVFDYPLMRATANWFNDYPDEQFGGLAAGKGPNTFFKPSHSQFLNMLGRFDRGLRILDIGSGYGRDAIALSGASNRVWGIDIAEHRIAQAGTNVLKANKEDRVTICNMDAHNLQFPENFFDVITATSLLMWVNKARLLDECRRVLKPGGKIIFCMETMPENPVLKLHRRRTTVLERERLVSRIKLDELGPLASRFSAMHSEQFYLVSPVLYPFALRCPRSKFVRALIRSLQLLDAGILHHWPNARRYAWVSVIEFIK